jgi:pantothenate kinase-related protein Tda10
MVMGISEYLKAEPFFLEVQGGAGTGKSFLDKQSTLLE